ncbi:MAG: hypothetical protein RLY69_52, partial [Verrucomicrobiota bacterium]
MVLAISRSLENLELAHAEESVVAQFLLDAEELIVLRDPVRAAHRASLDLTAVGRDSDVSDRAVLGLTGTVAEHGGV